MTGAGLNRPGGLGVPATAGNDDGGELVTVCNECKISLNVFTDPFGVSEYVHGQAWINHDHDPVPVRIPAREHTKVACDFCGRDDLVNWLYGGDEVETDLSHTSDGGILHGVASSHWSACDLCDPYLRDRDVPGLIDRIVRASAVLREFAAREGTLAPDTQRWRAQLEYMHGRFVPSIVSRTYVGPPRNLPTIRARQLPKLRDGLVRMWRSQHVQAMLAAHGKNLPLPGMCTGDDDTFIVRTPGPQLNADAYQTFTGHVTAGLYAARLYHVGGDFTYLATTTGAELPDVSLTLEELPAPHGFIVWQEPIGEVERPGGPAGIRAVSWTLVPGGVWVNAYIQPEDGDRSYERDSDLGRELGWLVAPNTGTGLPFITLDMPAIAGTNIMRTLLATWFLMAQPGVADTEQVDADHDVRRAYKRAGRRQPDVHLVDLRRQPAPARTGDAVAQPRALSVRFRVRGHWRRQAYGPERSLRKTILIAPFIKGPAGAPFKAPTPTVHVLR